MTPHEEILEALVEELRSLQELHEYEVGSEDAALAVSRARLNEILAKHELVPIDETPFDPERCGFIKLDHPHREESVLNLWTILKSDHGDWTIYKTNLPGETERLVYCEHLPWPTKHSDGVRLLQLLGLEVRG